MLKTIKKILMSTVLSLFCFLLSVPAFAEPTLPALVSSGYRIIASGGETGWTILQKGKDFKYCAIVMKKVVRNGYGYVYIHTTKCYSLQ